MATVRRANETPLQQQMKATAILERCLQDLVDDTNTLLIQKHGFPPNVVCPRFIRYWLQRGKTPQQVAMIAIGRRSATDAHEGGIDA